MPVADWMKLSGDVDRGKRLFADKATCATCHKIDDAGKEVGPALTEIGSKLSRTAMYEAILYPSAAINHGYQTYLALTDAGTVIVGILVGETDKTISMKTDKGVVHELQRKDLEVFRKQEVSLMPSGLHKLITPEELSDIVAYLMRFKVAYKLTC